MVINYYNKSKLCTEIQVNENEKTVQIKNFTDNPLDRAFGVNETPTWHDYESFLESRCFPRNRQHLVYNLKELGLREYDPLQICLKTEGRNAKDNQWMEFNTNEDNELDMENSEVEL